MQISGEFKGHVTNALNLPASWSWRGWPLWKNFVSKGLDYMGYSMFGKVSMPLTFRSL